MMVYTQSSYRPLSRKRKKLPKVSRKAKCTFEEYVPSEVMSRKTETKYKSVVSSHIDTSKTNEFKKELSKHYTIAPAYNKGGYQVISPDNIKDIGK